MEIQCPYPHGVANEHSWGMHSPQATEDSLRPKLEVRYDPNP